MRVRMGVSIGGPIFVLLFTLFALALAGDVGASLGLRAVERRPSILGGTAGRALVRVRRVCRIAAPVSLLLAGLLYVGLAAGATP